MSNGIPNNELGKAVLFLGLLFGTVYRFEDLVAALDRRLHKFFATAQLLNKPDILHFALIPFQGAIDGF